MSAVPTNLNFLIQEIIDLSFSGVPCSRECPPSLFLQLIVTFLLIQNMLIVLKSNNALSRYKELSFWSKSPSSLVVRVVDMCPSDPRLNPECRKNCSLIFLLIFTILTLIPIFSNIWTEHPLVARNKNDLAIIIIFDK